MSWLDLVADELDPPEPAEHLRSPVNYAVARSRGEFLDFPHVRAYERTILETIQEGGRLLLEASVRHAKSQTVSKWLPAWYIGTNPNRRVGLAGHEHDFAARWGRAVRDVLIEHGEEDFGVKVSKRSEAANRWDLEAPHVGGMLTVGVGGSPIGRGFDLMIIDDPCKSFEDAMSPLKRERLKEWYTGTMASRVEPGGAVIILAARWHADDLPGFLEQTGRWKVLRLPALADDPDDPMGRELGEPLWPERWPREALEERHKDVSEHLGEAIWLAQYQQRPMPPGGGMFPENQWRFTQELPDVQWVRAWDLAASQDQGDYTVGVLMARLPDDGPFIVSDVIRGRWDSWGVRSQMLHAAATDPEGTDILIPQDPGQAGKAQAAQLIAMLAGYNVTAELQSGSKEIRANGYASQQQAGNIQLLEARWNGAFVQEHAQFPRGAHDDQVDAAASAFNAIAGTKDPGIRWL